MTASRRSWHCAALLALAAIVFPLVAQQAQPGRITGTITDTTHQVLPGASIALQPGKRTLSSDAGGGFTISGLAQGEYTLTIRYIGFQTANLPVTVEAGQTVTVAPILKVSAASQTVEVTAPRPYGEAESLNIQRTSDNIVDALPESVITSLPNANVADAVGRMPGVTLERDEGEGKYLQIRGTEPRLSNVTVDGVELPAPESGIRQVKLDVIPSGLIGDIVLNKTLEPDQSGDAIGGSVNLVTKTATRQPTLTLYSNGGFAPIDNTRYSGEVGGTMGRRFGARQQWGAILSGSYDYNARGIDDVEPVPDALATIAAPTVDNADFRQYLYRRHRHGFGGSVDFVPDANDTLYLRGLFADFVDAGQRTIYNLDATGNGPSLGSEQRIGDYLISSLILGGNHNLGTNDTSVTWQVSAARSRMLYPQFDNTLSFAYTGPASQCTYNSQAAAANPYLPQFAPVCFTEAYNDSNFALTNVKRGNHGVAAHVDLAGQVDVTRFYSIGGNPGSLKFGASTHATHQFDDSWQLDYAPATDPTTGQPFSLPASMFLLSSYTNTNYYNGNYKAGPFLAYMAGQIYVAQHPNQFVQSSTQGADPNNYSLTENIPAGYIMDSNDIGRYRLVGGLRLEQTSVNTLSPDANNALTVPGTYSYFDLLPSASLQYKLDQNSDLRFAYGRGISRPIPSDLTSAISEDLTVNPKLVSLGNPGLKPEHGDDLDLLYERYFTPLGLVRGGLFYKHLSDPIVSLQTEPTSGPYAGFRVSQPANAGSAHILGFETSFEQHFGGLPGPLRGLGLTGNYSYTTSQALDVAPGVRSDSPRLLRQAPNTWNLSPTYDRGRFSGRVGLAFNQANVFQYNFADGDPGGVTGPSGDVYEYTHFQVDAQADIALRNGFSLTLSGLNLNNAVFGFYQGSPQFPIQREFYHPTYSIGLRWTLGSE